MKLRAFCNRCWKRWYEEDIPKWKTIFDIDKKHKCRVRTRKKLQDFLPRSRVNGKRKFNWFYNFPI